MHRASSFFLFLININRPWVKHNTTTDDGIVSFRNIVKIHANT